MSTEFIINIAKAHTMNDWRGLPAHRHFASVKLDASLGEPEALTELKRLQEVYSWPEYHLSLTAERAVRNVHNIASTAPADFLNSHHWAFPSIHKS